jgi:hypothetical protein
LQICSLFCKCSSIISLISMLSLRPEILSSTYSSLPRRLSVVFFIWLMKFLIPRFLFDSSFFFFETVYIFVKLLFHILYCDLYLFFFL